MIDSIARGLALKSYPLTSIHPSGLPILPGAAAIIRKISNAGSGQNDLYTVPAGKRAIFEFANAYNRTVGSLTFTLQVKIGGTYYNIRDALTVNTVAANGANSPAFIMEAGEILSVNTSGAGLNLFARLIEFDNSSAFKSARLMAIVSGDQTLYTAPAGVDGLFMNTTLANLNSAGGISFYNNTGGTRTWTIYQTANGVTASSTDAQVAGVISTNNGSVGLTSINSTGVRAGESLVLNSDGAGSGMIWAPVIEFRAA